MGLIKSPAEIELMRQAGEILRDCFLYIEPFVKPGITTAELDKLAENYILSRGAKPGFKGVDGFPFTICASVNEELVHGYPSKRVLKEGDIISIDCGALYKGYNSDATRTYPVGEIDEESKQLIEVTRQCFFEAIKPLKDGVRLSLIGHQISNLAHKYGYGVVRDLCGHGIGKQLHENPRILNYENNSSFIVQEGMCLAIEPMINLGSPEVVFDRKTIAVTTKDKRRCAHYENTVLITKNGVEILTE